MARIAGVDLPNNKRLDVALTYLYGIGRHTATKICVTTGLDPSKRAHTLTPDDIAVLRDAIDGKYKVEGDLRKDVNGNIRRLIEIGSYRGLRHRLGLPVRGQRTQTNARTRKGKSVAIAGKKK